MSNPNPFPLPLILYLSLEKLFTRGDRKTRAKILRELSFELLSGNLRTTPEGGMEQRTTFVHKGARQVTERGSIR